MAPILILHGWGSCAKNWQRIKELLENRGIKVLVPDLPGFGENPPPNKPWSINDYTEWIKGYCEKKGLSDFFLLGHSFGGGLAVKLANVSPDKIHGLILVGAKIRRYKTIRYYLGTILSKVGQLIFFTSFLRPIARKVLYQISGVRDYYKLDVAKALTMKETFKEIVATDLTSLLQAIKTPTLIIWGDSDNMTPLKDAYLIHRGITGSRLDIIKHGEHNLNLQMPEVLAEKIIKFITN